MELPIAFSFVVLSMVKRTLSHSIMLGVGSRKINFVLSEPISGISILLLIEAGFLTSGTE